MESHPAPEYVAHATEPRCNQRIRLVLRYRSTEESGEVDEGSWTLDISAADARRLGATLLGEAGTAERSD